VSRGPTVPLTSRRAGATALNTRLVECAAGAAPESPCAPGFGLLGNWRSAEPLAWQQVSAPERERAANFRRADESKNARRIHRAALSVRGREQELVEWDEDGAEKARCVGLLHACQSWLELKDGESNTISITAPDDSGKQLVDEKVVLPASGAANISDATWTVLQKACK
jgi:hypothetical protein